jgi:hypothetical protein
MKSISDFGALGTSDDSPVFQIALDAAKADNHALSVPPGTFQLGSQLNYVTSSTNPLTPGLILVGEGAEKTVLNSTHTGPTLNIGTNTPYKFQRHGIIEGMSFTGPGTGIKLSSAYHYQLNGLQIAGKTLYGIHIPTLIGDGDACNNITIDQVDIVGCKRWGLFGEVVSGANELSFLNMRNTRIESCGTVEGAIGGGMYWRGQQLGMSQVGFVTNNNRGLYIEGGAGLGSDVYGTGVSFENNLDIHLQCYGIKGMVFDALQMYSNDNYKTKYGIRIDAQSSVATNVDIRSGTVRATAGNNPHTAFLAFGANFSNCKARNITWDNYDHQGQTRLVGFTN